MVRTAEIDHILQRTPEPNRTYLQDIIRQKRLAGVKDTSITTHISHIWRFLADIGQPDARTIARAQIEDWYLSKKGEVSPATLKGYIISIGVLMQSLHGGAGKDLTAGIKIKVPLTNVRADQLVTDDEIRRMMRAATCERDRTIIAVLYSSGARLGEVCNIKLGDVSLSRYGASIHVDGKTGERDIDMFVGVPELRAWLNVHPLRSDKTAPLFTTLHPRGGRYRPLSPKAVQTFCQRIGRRAEIPEGKRTNPHAYRHKRATDVADYLTLSDMRGMFGWAQGSSMPAIYVHSTRDKVRTKLAEHAGIKAPEVQTPTTMVKQCTVCGCINGANDLICNNCHAELAEGFAAEYHRLRQYLSDGAEELLQDKK